MLKQVIIIRKDLKMRKGKMCAQVAHASMKIFFDRMYISVDNNSVVTNFTPEMHAWRLNTFTKIVVGCDSLEELLALQDKAFESDIVHALIEDAGATEFKESCPKCDNEEWTGTSCDRCNNTGVLNVPTVTCLAIGPDDSDKIGKITGHLKLL